MKELTIRVMPTKYDLKNPQISIVERCSEAERY